MGTYVYGGEAVKQGRLRKGGGIKLMRWFSTSCDNKLPNKSIKEAHNGVTGIDTHTGHF